MAWSEILGVSLGNGLFFILVSIVIIVFHELGHFWVGRWCGVKVETFSIGFGPELWSFRDRHQTRWRIAAIPLGGYVKFEGDGDIASLTTEAKAKTSLQAQSVGKRVAIILAGPLANLLLAAFVFSFILYVYGNVLRPPVVAFVEPGSAAAEAGFQSDDLILSINGKPVEEFAEVANYIARSPGQKMHFVVDRAGHELALEARPKAEQRVIAGSSQTVGILGIATPQASQGGIVKSYTLLEALQKGFISCADMTLQMVRGMGDIFWRFIQGEKVSEHVGGIVRIAELVGESASHGMESLLWISAAISISIGLFNLLPLPPLDGGLLMFCIAEFFRGQPLSEKVQGYIYRFSLAILLALIVSVNINDLVGLVFR